MDSITNDIHHRRLETQLQSLKNCPEGIYTSTVSSPFGQIVQIEIVKDVLAPLLLEDAEDMQFELHLEGKFPFQAPKLLACTQFTEPSISDGRDLLQEVLGGVWNPQNSILDVISDLPTFIKTARDKVNSEANYNIGQLHLGYPMFLTTWDDKQNMSRFNCVEIDPQNENFRKERTIVVTQLTILQLERTPKFPNFGHLISWATLYSLANIKRSKLDTSKLIFEWKPCGNSSGYSQYFEMQQANECVDLITENLTKLKVNIKRHTNLQAPSIKEEEVSAESLNKVNIDDILNNIKKEEGKLENADLTVDMIMNLMNLYQQAIEYYSALNDPMFDLLLNRMHSMLAEERVMKVLHEG